MAVNVVTITNLSNDLGFTRWNWIPLLNQGVLSTNGAIPYAPVPDHLVPAQEFQVASETATCSITVPWGGFADPFTEFELGGGTSGTILGAINGLNIVGQSFLQKTTAEYGLGREYLGPEFGYCQGKYFKEKIYSAISAQNVFNLVTVGQCEQDLVWRSRWERFYVNHGKITTFEKVSGELYKIVIPTGATNTSVGEVDFSGITETIALYSSLTGEASVYSINKVIGVEGELEIYAEAQESDLNIGDEVLVGGERGIITGISGISGAGSSGDYFVLSSSWLIQDPYILDGLLNNIGQSTTPTGSEEFFRTDQNQIISSGSFTGVYIRTERDEDLVVGDEVIVDGEEGIITGINN
jgi:hypothetical protein